MQTLGSAARKREGEELKKALTTIKFSQEKRVRSLQADSLLISKEILCRHSNLYYYKVSDGGRIKKSPSVLGKDSSNRGSCTSRSSPSPEDGTDPRKKYISMQKERGHGNSFK